LRGCSISNSISPVVCSVSSALPPLFGSESLFAAGELLVFADAVLLAVAIASRALLTQSRCFAAAPHSRK
jgi:hypothetical protein